MRYELPLLAVRDVEVSKRFYEELFDQQVTLDLGRNVTLSGGFALQQDFDWLVGIPKSTILHQSNNMELYFEVDDFDAFLDRLTSHPDVDLVHPAKKYEWQQRVVRLYDPDWHMIEVGESMAVIARRYLDEGHSVEQTAEIIQHPVEFVENCRKGLE
ncbi:glyoxalase/bleomycin resistance/dioxygenase family protein [Agathobaculum sp. NTUH-O15-33]|uniref:VOC family protein n=1 Tax=Agathobaculum sp. NTUH-O15-33 TaxID=3079302 RepID=UPI00295844CA|nr:VOC family protein [Agathobaculum sp. NTUH-O15-33]WNX86659.1 glyoxalase/bleomycin resistance/dioxygenase family protein [Agathobaculum sp. NTUH-O15-33]